MNGSGINNINPKTIQRFLLLIAFSAAIGYLISPRMIFLPTVYEEGDIILQTLVVEEDLLIPDKVSTRLKREQLIKEQAPVYDFDPKILDKTLDTVSRSFNEVRSEIEQLSTLQIEQKRQNRLLGLDYFTTIKTQREIARQITFYKKYRSILQNQLKTVQKGVKLTASKFEKKQKLDADMNAVSRILDDLNERMRYLKSEQNTFQDRFQKSRETNRQLKIMVDEKQSRIIHQFITALNITVDEAEQQLLLFSKFTEEIEQKLTAVLNRLLTRKIVISKEILSGEVDNHIDIRNLVTGEVKKLNNIKELNDIADIHKLVHELTVNTFPQDESGRKKNLIILLAQKLIKPTVTENKLEYEKRKMAAIDSMSPIYFSVKKGEIIARAGDRGTRHQVELIRSYYEVISNTDKLPQTVGIVMTVLITLLMISFAFSIRDDSKPFPFKKQLLIMTAVTITLILVKGGVLLGGIIETRYVDIPREIYPYMLPIALSSMLVGILISFECGIVAGLLSGLFASIMLQGNLYYFFFAIMGSTVASLPVTRFESRYSLLIHGLKISIINLPIVVVIFLIEKNQIGHLVWFELGFAAAGGLLTAVVASILLPFFESFFDITTNLRLLELSNMNHPALKDLIIKAPGTYQHSIIVGNLAESAARKIGANSLLARVASYYHDIGKTDEAHYFVENQSPNTPNIHNRMNPSDSVEKIIGHVQKGAKIAEKHRLGSAINQIMCQHHGKNRVEYFYRKSLLHSKENPDAAPPDENQFRYPGPKPQSQEAAVVMMADIAEAATRSIDEPTTQSIMDMVKNVCWNILKDGQLDESGITLKTFHEVVQVFTSMLISIHHQRIKYPDAPSAQSDGPMKFPAASSGVSIS